METKMTTVSDLKNDPALLAGFPDDAQILVFYFSQDVMGPPDEFTVFFTLKAWFITLLFACISIMLLPYTIYSTVRCLLRISSVPSEVIAILRPAEKKVDTQPRASSEHEKCDVQVENAGSDDGDMIFPDEDADNDATEDEHAGNDATEDDEASEKLRMRYSKCEVRKRAQLAALDALTGADVATQHPDDDHTEPDKVAEKSPPVALAFNNLTGSQPPPVPAKSPKVAEKSPPVALAFNNLTGSQPPPVPAKSPKVSGWTDKNGTENAVYDSSK
jgi:hypothetical protein